MPSVFRRGSAALLFIIAGSFLVGQDGLAAPEFQPFRLSVPKPRTWEQIDTIMSWTNRDPAVNIPANVNAALCGGWDFEQSVGNTLGPAASGQSSEQGGKIAKVTGVPGREGEPLGDILSGMAPKAGELIYPDNPATTCGFMSACLANAQGKIIPLFQYQYPPFYAPMPCQRPLGPWVDTKFEEDCKTDHKCNKPRGSTTGNCEDPDNPGVVGATCTNDEQCNRLCCVDEQCILESAQASAALKYACGGGDMEAAATDGDLCGELYKMGTTGGLCEKLNSDWLYTLWVRPTFDQNPDTEQWEHTGWRFQKGDCRRNTERYDEVADPVPDEKKDAQYKKPDWWNDVYEQKFGLSDSVERPDGSLFEWKGWEYRPAVKNQDRYCCTDKPVGEDPNCMTCAGETCRNGPEFSRIIAVGWPCEYPPVPPFAHPSITECLARPTLFRGKGKYRSYYRHYEASYARARVEGVPKDDTRRPKTDDPEKKGIPVSCYGRWTDNTDKEIDPLVDVTFNQRDPTAPTPEGRRSVNYRRCVIAAYYDPKTPYGDNHFFQNDGDDMRLTQEERGAWMEFAPYQDPPRGADDPKRSVFKVDEDLWFEELGDGFSLLNGKKLAEDFNNDLSQPLMTLDEAQQRAGVQFTLLKNNSGAIMFPRSSGALLRAFDDTGQRGFVTWWQKQQTAAHEFFSPPVVRMTLPASAAVGLDPLHPLFTPDLPLVNDPGWDKNPFEQPIEVQLEMREGLLGQIADYLMDALFLQFKEEKIPVVVPLASATELRAIKQSWCVWHMAQKKKDNCDDVDGKLADFMTDLDDYIVRIEEVRNLRAELASQLALYLKFNDDLQKGTTDWVLQNTLEFGEYMKARDERFSLLPQWRSTQSTYQRFQDRTNMPWCRDDRFTPPIYSFLDPWFNVDGIRDLSGQFLPQIPQTSLPDVVLDFSHLSISNTGALLRVPVIEPVQIHLNMEGLAAPALNEKNPIIPVLADFPALPTLKNLTQNMPLPAVLTVPVVNLPSVQKYVPPTDDGDTKNIFSKISSIILTMNSTYNRFWNSLTIDPDDIWDETEEDCYRWNEVESFGGEDETAGRCVHVEQDLIERFTRIAARPGILLREDLESQGESFPDPYEDGFDYCNYEDWVCLALNGEVSYPRAGWHVTGVGNLNQADPIAEARRAMVEASLQFGVTDPAKLIPYALPRNQILPTFSRPLDVQLLLPVAPAPPPE